MHTEIYQILGWDFDFFTTNFIAPGQSMRVINFVIVRAGNKFGRQVVQQNKKYVIAVKVMVKRLQEFDLWLRKIHAIGK